MGSCTSKSVTVGNPISHKPCSGSEYQQLQALTGKEQVETEIKPLTVQTTPKPDHEEQLQE